MTDEVVNRVRRRLVETGAPASRAALAALVRTESESFRGGQEVLQAVRQAESAVSGAGPLEPLLSDPLVTDVLVNGPDQVWVDRGAGLERVPVRFRDEAEVRLLAQRLGALAGRRLDDAQPWVDGALPDGTRLHAVLPPVATDGSCVSLRSFRRQPFSLSQLVAAGTLSAQSADLLRQIVQARLSFLVTGGAGSGKTTLLTSMLGLLGPGERLVVVEDAPELRPDHEHTVRLASRPPNVEGAGQVSLRDLVRQALRMRPDRLVVGEVRGAEVVEMLTAFNTGHDGGAATVHANSSSELPARLEALAGLGGLARQALHSQLAAAVQVVLHVARTSPGQRLLTEIGVLRRRGELVSVVPGWACHEGPSIGWAELLELLASTGRSEAGS